MADSSLSKSTKRVLKGYGEDVKRNLGIITKKFGQAGARALRRKSRDELKSHSGKYAKGWTYGYRETRRSAQTTIYNERYSLPHLLEHGHVTRNGTGRTFAPTPAHKHIAPVDEELTATYEREVLDKL